MAMSFRSFMIKPKPKSPSLQSPDLVRKMFAGVISLQQAIIHLATQREDGVKAINQTIGTCEARLVCGYVLLPKRFGRSATR
jgi:hypothetical protein